MTVRKKEQEDIPMQKKQPLRNRIRLVYRRGSPLAKAVVLAAIVLSTAAMLTLTAALNHSRDRAEQLKNQAAELEQEQSKLEQNIAGLGTLDSVEQIAKDELGLVDPDTVVIEPEQ